MDTVMGLTAAYHGAAGPQHFLSAQARILLSEWTSFVLQPPLPYGCVTTL